MAEEVTYTSGLLRLGKPTYKKVRWDTILNSNTDVIARLGQDDISGPPTGASLVALPQDIQGLFGPHTNLKSALQYIHDNYVHATSGVYDAMDIDGVGLVGPLYREYVCSSTIAAYRCVYLKYNEAAPLKKPYIDVSDVNMGEKTMPALGLTLDRGELNTEVRVATYGPVTNSSWEWKTYEQTGDPAYRYVYVGENGIPAQFPTGTPVATLQIMGLVEGPTTVFLKPDLVFGKMEV